MADKTIGALNGIESLDEDSLFVAEQNGEAVKVSGKQLTDFANVETAEQVESAAKSAEAAKSAAESAGTAILKAPIIREGTWWVYNQEQGAYQDTGVSATGPTGPAGPTQSVNDQTPDENGNVTVDSTQIKQPDGTVIKTILDRAAAGGALDQQLQRKVNLNLLDNWYFGDPVNTQGKTEYASTGYTVDRWRMSFTTGSLAIVDNGIQFKGTGGQTNRLTQYFQHPLAAGRTYTLSCLLDNVIGADSSINFYYNESTPVLIGACNANTLTEITFTAAADIANIFCQQPSETDYTIIAIKLELGDQQTLAHQDADGNWVLNEIPNKAEQLAICSQYDPSSGAYKGTLLAPAGFGLGENYTTGPFMTQITADTIDTTLTNGWYFANGVDIAGNSQAVVRVDSTGRTITQTAYIGLKDYVLKRCLPNTLGTDPANKFSPWEWVNPPMQLGVEYRTTERYLGKPVYVKLVYCGIIVDGKSVDLGLDSPDIIISADVVVHNAPSPAFYAASGIGNYGHSYFIDYYNAMPRTGSITFHVGDLLNSSQLLGYAKIKYTKTTD